MTRLRLVRELGAKPGVEVVNSINPVRIEGQKTAAFEICDALGPRAPISISCRSVTQATSRPTGKASANIRRRASPISVPRMCGFQAAGAAPLVSGQPVLDPQTIATAIRIGNPASWTGATTALAESKGVVESVTDEEILTAYNLTARREGLFAEPASVAPVAGLLRMGRNGLIPRAA